MASSYKILGQLAPTAQSLSNLYIVPASTSAVASTLVICNTGTSATTARVACRPAGGAIAIQHYIIYDVLIPAGDSTFLTLGISLAETDVVSVYANVATLSFSLFGSEVV